MLTIEEKNSPTALHLPFVEAIKWPSLAGSLFVVYDWRPDSAFYPRCPTADSVR